MLSRVANELYWIGRHIERAENTARLLDVTYRTSLLPYHVGEPGLAWAAPWAVPLITTGLATGYWNDGADWRRGHNGPHFSASGGLVGSAADLASWASALLAGRGPLAGMLERLTAPRHFADGSESVYRLGLVASRLGETAIIGHGGSLAGYRNHFWMSPAHGS